MMLHVEGTRNNYTNKPKSDVERHWFMVSMHLHRSQIENHQKSEHLIFIWKMHLQNSFLSKIKISKRSVLYLVWPNVLWFLIQNELLLVLFGFSNTSNFAFSVSIFHFIMNNVFQHRKDANTIPYKKNVSTQNVVIERTYKHP